MKEMLHFSLFWTNSCDLIVLNILLFWKERRSLQMAVRCCCYCDYVFVSFICKVVIEANTERSFAIKLVVWTRQSFGSACDTLRPNFGRKFSNCFQQETWNLVEYALNSSRIACLAILVFKLFLIGSSSIPFVLFVCLLPNLVTLLILQKNKWRWRRWRFPIQIPIFRAVDQLIRSLPDHHHDDDE